MGLEGIPLLGYEAARSNGIARRRVLVRGTAVIGIIVAGGILIARWPRPSVRLVVVAALSNPDADPGAAPAYERLKQVVGPDLKITACGPAWWSIAVRKSQAPAVRKRLRAEADRDPAFAAKVTTAPGSGWSAAPVEP